MLVLTRKLQEKIRIGDRITITVLRMKGKAVRLGIEAPQDVPVIRGELVFETSPEESGQPPGSSAADESAPLSAAARADGQWTTDSRPHLPAGRVRGLEPKNEVRMVRVPRDKVAQMLPRLASEGGPLRAMLDQRSSTC